MRVVHYTPYYTWLRIKKNGFIRGDHQDPAHVLFKPDPTMLAWPHFAIRNTSGWVELTFEIDKRWLKRPGEDGGEIESPLWLERTLVSTKYLKGPIPKPKKAWDAGPHGTYLVRHPNKKMWMLLQPNAGRRGRFQLYANLESVEEDAVGLEEIDPVWPFEIPERRSLR